jgi:hypothetical protein
VNSDRRPTSNESARAPSRAGGYGVVDDLTRIAKNDPKQYTRIVLKRAERDFAAARKRIVIIEQHAVRRLRA